MNKTKNKETYYKLSNMFKLLCHSCSLNKNSKYYLTNKDNKEKNYIILKENNISLKVPFKALFNTNNKLNGIYSISFDSAVKCPSKKLGLCQLPNNKLCYAIKSEKRASKTSTNKGFLCMNSYNNGLLSRVLIDIMVNNCKILERFINYLNNSNIKLIRFNLKSDFKDIKDIYFILTLALYCNNIKFYGYTARSDLIPNKESIKYIPNNLYINGSNKLLTNRFKTTINLKEWYTSKYKCHGNCLKCGNCYTLKDKTIYCLLHGSNSDIYLNTFDNRAFIKCLLSGFNITITHTILKEYKGLFKSVNNYFIKTFNINLTKDYNITNIKEFIEFL